jgi:hypothetical protein
MFSFDLDPHPAKTHVLNMFNSTTNERYARAVGRIAFGTVMLAGAAILVQRAIAMDAPAAGKVIAATWIVAGFCGWVSRQVTAPFSEHARVEDIFTLSYAVPAFGLALMLPLSIHLVVAGAFGLATEFDGWVRLSLVITGAAHVAFAGLVAWRAVQLARGQIAISTKRIYVTTLIVSSIPFALILFIPPLLVGLTGLVIVPLTDRMPALIDRERGIAPPLPKAVVV